jgi:hypothetical protein
MGLNGENQECIKNFGEETSWNMITGGWDQKWEYLTWLTDKFFTLIV